MSRNSSFLEDDDEEQGSKLLGDEDTVDVSEQEQQDRKRWSLFRWKKGDRSDDDDEELNESSALLKSCPNLDLGNEGPLLLSNSTAQSRIVRQSSSDQTDNLLSSSSSDVDKDDDSPRFSLLPSDSHEQEQKENYDSRFHVSEPVIRFSDRQLDKIKDGPAGMDADRRSNSNSSSDSSESSSSEEDDLSSSQKDNEGGRNDQLALVPYKDNESRRNDNLALVPYKDKSAHPDRQRVNNRIEGFGNGAPNVPAPIIKKQMSLRERIRNYRENRTNSMEIGTEETAGRIGWASSIENIVIDLVDSILPPDAADAKPKPNPPTPRRPHSNPENEGCIKDKRRQITDGNAYLDDDAYITYLERELRNKDFEIVAWKKRVDELEKEIRFMKGNSGDDSSVDSNGSKKEEKESEIEWQSGVPKEGILIDTGDSAEKIADTPTESERTTQGQSKEGILIDVESASENNLDAIPKSNVGSDVKDKTLTKEGTLRDTAGGEKLESPWHSADSNQSHLSTKNESPEPTPTPASSCHPKLINRPPPYMPPSGPIENSAIGVYDASNVEERFDQPKNMENGISINLQDAIESNTVPVGRSIPQVHEGEDSSDEETHQSDDLADDEETKEGILIDTGDSNAGKRDTVEHANIVDTSGTGRSNENVTSDESEGDSGDDEEENTDENEENQSGTDDDESDSDEETCKSESNSAPKDGVLVDVGNTQVACKDTNTDIPSATSENHLHTGDNETESSRESASDSSDGDDEQDSSDDDEDEEASEDEDEPKEGILVDLAKTTVNASIVCSVQPSLISTAHDG